MAQAKALTSLGVSVLALLCEEPMHPYEMYQLLIARKEDRIVKIRPGSLYHAVDRLAEQQLVKDVGTERDGKRPERTTYEITPEGRTALTERIGHLLETPVREYPHFVLGLSEMHNLSAPDAMALLRRRIEHLQRESDELGDIEASAARRHIPEIFFAGIGYLRAVIAAEVHWLMQFVERVERGDVAWLTQDMAADMVGRRNNHIFRDEEQ